VNTASRLESSGLPNHIHASRETVQLLRLAKKTHWISERSEMVNLKGKGLLQTYWVHPCYVTKSVVTDDIDLDADMLQLRDKTSCSVNAIADSGKLIVLKYDRQQRLVNWNVDVLYRLLETLVRSRPITVPSSGRTFDQCTLLPAQSSNCLVIDEMTEILRLPSFDEKSFRNAVASTKKNSMLPCVKQQLHEFVHEIANLYRDVPFHNFEHASHVIMSAGKLMKRIVNPDGVDDITSNKGIKQKIPRARQIHASTYGISSDFLMQFATAFSALIHDVDHTGFTNKELIDMQAPVAAAYREKCIAEQNSVNVAWHILMKDKYQDLRMCIYSTEEELKRFRELIVDAVLATDIADKELQTLRKNRWADAFSDQVKTNDEDSLDIDRKATIVFEHIIQASDVCHCMQHWQVYQKYNARLFEERYVAFLKGKAGENPPWAGWYKGEIWFYDNYIIPLAQKLNDCGVFGVSYDEYLNYAQQNRLEWEHKGEDIVAQLRVAVEKKYKDVLVPATTTIIE
jgi:hypothetical protein